MRSTRVDGPEVRKVREAKGLSVPAFVARIRQDKEFAKTGKTVSVSMVGKIEKHYLADGSREPGPALFAAIKRVLKVVGEDALLVPQDEVERGAA